MRRWIRWLLVRVLRFTIRRRPGSVATLQEILWRAYAHRDRDELDAIWAEAYRGL